MKKNLLFVICFCLTSLLGTRAMASTPPAFTGGHQQYMPVCESAGLYYINGFLIVNDADLSETETWSVALNASHGTVVASYSAPSTGTVVSPSGLTYTPTPGYVGADTFAVMVSDGTFADTTYIAVTINPLPNAGTVTGPATLCTGTSAIYSTTGTGGTWATSNPNATAAGDTITGVHPGQDSVVYYVINSCGTAVAAQVITVSSMPAVGPISAQASVCIGSSITVSAPFAGGTWTVTNGNASITGTSVTGVAAGIDTIMHIATNSCGTDTARAIITVDTGIVTPAAITGLDHVCTGASITLTDATAGGIWSNTTALGSISGTGVLTAGTVAGADTVAYTIANGCGSSSMYKIVHVLALPAAGTITGYDSVCAGSSITLIGTPAGGTWTSSIPEFAAVDAAGVVTGALNGSTVIHYTITNACGTATADHAVRVNVPAQPITGDLTLCQAALGMYSDAVGGGTWSSSSLFNAIPIPLVAGNFLGGIAGPVDIIYTVNNACGTTTATLSIEVIVCNSTGVNEVAPAHSTMSITPNPNNGSFTMAIPTATGEDATVTITNMLGATVKVFSIKTNTAVPVTVDVPAGVYLLTASANNAHYTARIVVAQ